MKAKPFLFMAGLVTITALAMVAAGKMNTEPRATVFTTGSKNGLIHGEARLVQHKVLKNSDGNVAVAVTLTAAAPEKQLDGFRRPVDLTVVLDRSGSMQGEKIRYAKEALTKLLGDLSETDRLALVSYSNDATVHSGLMAMTPQNRRQMAKTIAAVSVGGGTNLESGLTAGIQLMSRVEDDLTIRHLLVISDGLANQGITDPERLGQIAVEGSRNGISVGSVGVGVDFNEQLMTLLADRGQGRYYFLENPVAFAGLFTEEYRRLGMIAATDVQLELKTGPDVNLVDAAGYPFELKDGQARIRPGNIKMGGTRTLYLTFRVPTGQPGAISLGRMVVTYRHQNLKHTLVLGSELSIACVDNPEEVWASVEKEGWTRKVLENDFSLLKKEIAKDVSRGDSDRAMERIESYRNQQAVINAAVGSAEVEENIDHGVDSLRRQIQETFSGAPAEVMQKQKSTAKSLHYEGYKGQRAVK